MVNPIGAVQGLRGVQRRPDDDVPGQRQPSAPVKLTLSQLRGRDGVDLSPQAVIRLTEDMLRTSLGEALSAKFEAHGVELGASVGVDMSAEATARRIVSFATGLKDTFLRQNQNLSEEEALHAFEDTIRGAVRQGFGEAQKVLEGMGVWQHAQSVAEDTLSHVERLFDEYFAEPAGAAQKEAPAAR